MKNVVLILGFAILFAVFTGCKSSKTAQDNKNSGGHNSQNSLDWEGSYSGILPCEDCDGIQFNLKLKGDKTYEMKYSYEGKVADPVESYGKFSWKKNAIAIELDSRESLNRFAVGEDGLTLLDENDKKVTDSKGNNYVLLKVDLGLVEKYWKLIEIIGEPVDASKYSKEPYLILKIDGNRVNGNNGCNSLLGSYQIFAGNRIKFSKMGSTMMMCPNIDLEAKMGKVFETVDNYTLKNDTLSLNKARMAPLARFVAVYMK